MMGRERRLGLLPRVVLAQFLAFITVLMVVWGLAHLAPDFRPPQGLVPGAQGALAVAFSLIFGLRRGWLAAQFILPPLAWAGLALNVPSWVFLAAFALMFLVYFNASKERVPLYLSNRTTWAALSEVLAERDIAPGTCPVFMDLGCGLGGVLQYLARRHGNWRFVGVENAPGPFLVSWLRSLGVPNLRIEYKSLWEANLTDADIVYAFLSPAPMPKLIDVAEQTMHDGASLISNSFWAPDRPYDAEIEVNDTRRTRLYVKNIQREKK